MGEAVNTLLERKVEEMLRSPAAHSVPHGGRPSQLPLLRLKVQHRCRLAVASARADHCHSSPCRQSPPLLPRHPRPS